MIHLHVTKKLLAKLPIDEHGLFAEQPKTQYLSERTFKENPLSGWHGNLLILQRRNCVLLVHDATRFPLFIPCLTKPDFEIFEALFMDSFMNTLLKCGATEAQLDAASHYMSRLKIDSECNRSVQGTMNQMKGDIEHMLRFDNVDVMDLSGYRTGVWLSDRPCNVKGQKDCIWPQKAMLSLLSSLAENPLEVEETKITLPDNVVSLNEFRNRK